MGKTKKGKSPVRDQALDKAIEESRKEKQNADRDAREGNRKAKEPQILVDAESLRNDLAEKQSASNAPEQSAPEQVGLHGLTVHDSAVLKAIKDKVYLYNGNTDPHQWLATIEGVAAQNEKLCLALVVTKVAGTAQIVVQQLKPTTYGQCKTALLDHFSSRTLPTEAIGKTIQAEDETAVQYIGRLMGVATLYGLPQHLTHGKDDPQLVAHALERGLRPDLRREIKRTMISNQKSANDVLLKEIMRWAQQFEEMAASESVRAVQTAAAVCSTEQPHQASGSPEYRGGDDRYKRVYRGSDRKPNNKEFGRNVQDSRDKRDRGRGDDHPRGGRWCNYCKMGGHVTSECYKLQAELERDGRRIVPKERQGTQQSRSSNVRSLNSTDEEDTEEKLDGAAGGRNAAQKN